VLANNALESGAPAGWLAAVVPSVLCDSRLAQVADSIVGPVSIDVIDLFDGPTAMLDKPSDPVSVVGNPINLDADIPAGMHRASDSPCSLRWPTAVGLPPKKAS